MNLKIDRLMKWGSKYSADSPFRHRRVRTKSMEATICSFLHRVYEMWCSIFNHHAINRLSIHSVSPKRDFLSSLMVLDQMVSNGFFPTELIMRELALIPAHCAMEHELLLMDRWMTRLRMTPFSASLEMSHPEGSRWCHHSFFDVEFDSALLGMLCHCFLIIGRCSKLDFW